MIFTFTMGTVLALFFGGATLGSSALYFFRERKPTTRELATCLCGHTLNQHSGPNDRCNWFSTCRCSEFMSKHAIGTKRKTINDAAEPDPSDYGFDP